MFECRNEEIKLLNNEGPVAITSSKFISPDSVGPLSLFRIRNNDKKRVFF